jgi:hypothetical protein
MGAFVIIFEILKKNDEGMEFQEKHDDLPIGIKFSLKKSDFIIDELIDLMFEKMAFSRDTSLIYDIEVRDIIKQESLKRGITGDDKTTIITFNSKKYFERFVDKDNKVRIYAGPLIKLLEYEGIHLNANDLYYYGFSRQLIYQVVIDALYYFISSSKTSVKLSELKKECKERIDHLTDLNQDLNKKTLTDHIESALIDLDYIHVIQYETGSGEENNKIFMNYYEVSDLGLLFSILHYTIENNITSIKFNQLIKYGLNRFWLMSEKQLQDKLLKLSELGFLYREMQGGLHQYRINIKSFNNLFLILDKGEFS